MRAVVFDFDGVLIDTETPELEGLQELYGYYEVEFPTEAYLGTIGGDVSFDPLEYLAEHVQGSLDVETVRSWWQRRHVELVEGYPLRPGVEQYLERARDRGLHIALASSSDRHWVVPLLQRHHLERYFEAVVTKDMVDRVKPDPELYRAVLTRLKVDGGEAVAFEDSINGAKAAKAAGLFCVAVPNPVTEQLSWPPCLVDLRLENFWQCTLDDVLAQLDVL